MSTRGESLRMIAEVSLSTAGGAHAVVGDRPLHRWWADVQPLVRTVLLAPQPSTTADRVYWSWTQGARSVAASRQEMVAIRRALEESAAALVAAVTKEARQRAVFDAYAEVLRALASRSNSELERYVCVTPFGPMLHSWCASVAAIPRVAQSAELEISGKVVVMGKPDGGHQVVLIDSRGTTIGRTRSDARGRFQFANVAAGRYRLRGVSERVDFPVTGIFVDLEDTSVEHLELKSSATMAARDRVSEARAPDLDEAIPEGGGDGPLTNAEQDRRQGAGRRWITWIVVGGVIALLPLIYWLTIGSDERTADDLAVTGSVNQAADQNGDLLERSVSTTGGGGRSRESENDESFGFNRFRNKALPSMLPSPRVGPSDGRGTATADQAGSVPGGADGRLVAGSVGEETSTSASPDYTPTAARSNGQGFVSKRGGAPASVEGVGQDPAGAPAGPGGGVAEAKSDPPAAAMDASNAAGSGSASNAGPGGAGAKGSGISSVGPAAASTPSDPSPTGGSPPADAVRSSSASALPPPSRNPSAPSERQSSDRTPATQPAPVAHDTAKHPRERSPEAVETKLDPERNPASRLESTRSGNEVETENTESPDRSTDPEESKVADQQEDPLPGSPRTTSGKGGGPKADQSREVPESPVLDEPPVAAPADGFLDAPLDPGPGVPVHAPLERTFRVRIAPWKSVLIRDQIVPTMPLPIGSPDETDARRRELLEQQTRLLPDELANAIRWQGIGVSFEAEEAGEWRAAGGGPVEGGRIGSGEAEVGWRETELAQDRELHWMTARGRVVTVTTTRTGEIVVAARKGVRVFLWVAVETGPPAATTELPRHVANAGRVVSLASGEARAESVVEPVKPGWSRRVQWRSLGPDSKSMEGWRASEWKDGIGRRLEMPLIADAGAQPGTRLALLDEATGWALITTIRLSP